MTIYEEAYEEIKALYEELQVYLNAVILPPEQESLLKQQEEYGKKMMQYHIAMIEKDSELLKKSREDFESLIGAAKSARKELDGISDRVEDIVKVTKVVEKVLEKLISFV